MRPSDSPEQDAAAAGRVKRAEFARFALENLFTISPDAIFVTDDGGIIRAANPRAIELFGYTFAELIDKPIEDLVPERYRGRHPAHRENYHAHPRSRQMGAAMNLFGLRKDGIEFPVDIMLRPLKTPAGLAVLSIVRDVTEQREAQEIAHRSDLQLRSLVEGVRDYAIYLLDKEGYITTWNPGAERIKQYSAEEIIGKHFSHFFTQEDVERQRPAELLRLAGIRGRIEEEGWRVRKDGSRFWADVILTAIRDDTGELTGFAKVTRDFTDRKRADEALMLQLSTALLSNMDISKLLLAISASIHEVIPHDNAAVALYDPDAGDLVAHFLGPQNPALFPGELRLSLTGTLSGLVFRTREPILVERLREISEAPATIENLTKLGMQSGCWVPLIHHGKSIGTLSVLSRMEGAIGQQEADTLVRIATPGGYYGGGQLDRLPPDCRAA